jgi:dipeptidyl aminopeptidase/acylaminoacyl peptidase
MKCTEKPWEHPATVAGTRHLAFSGADGTTSDWALYRAPDRGAVWVVVLHGHGSAADQLFTRADIRAHWLEWILAQGLGVLTPQLRGNAWMHAGAVADLHQLAHWLRTEHAARRLLLLGGSMGGASALIHAICHPADFQVVAALCPATDLADLHGHLSQRTESPHADVRQAIETAYGGAPAARAEEYACHSALGHAHRLTMPLFVAHGAQDPLIPVEHVLRLRDAMATGAETTFEILPGGGHDAPLTAPGLLPWLAGRLKAPTRSTTDRRTRP